MLPATLLAFLRPFPLPYAWVAPPEPMGAYYTHVSMLMMAGLVAYHCSTLRREQHAETLVRYASAWA